MTRARRRSKSVYLNACRKLGYRPGRGYVYRGGRWLHRHAFRLTVRATEGSFGVPTWGFVEG